MKKFFYSIVLLVTLVIVAGSAKGQTGDKPYPGGKYTYTLGGIKLNSAGKVKIEYSGGVSGTTINNFVGLTGTDLLALDIAATITEIKFDITYDLAESAGLRTIKVTITEGTCSNFISKSIEIQNKPALTLSLIAENTTICQLVNENPNDNTAAAVTDGVIENTFTYKVTPAITNVANGGTYSYEYEITLPSNNELKDFTITGNANYNPATQKVTYTNVSGNPQADIFTVKYKTTTGKPDQSLQAQLGNSKLTVASGGGQYTGTITTGLSGTSTVIVKALPSIGSFTWNP